MKKGIHIINPKQQERIYHHTSFYSICDMSSCRKSEIQHDLPKITKIKWICYFFNKQWQKILNYVCIIMFNNCSIEF